MREVKEIEYSYLGCIFDNPPERIVEALDLGTKVEWFSDLTCQLAWAAVDSLRKKTQISRITPLGIVNEAIKLSTRPKSRYYGRKIDPKFIEEANRFKASSPATEKVSIAAYAPILRDAYLGRSVDTAVQKAAGDAEFDSNSARINALLKQLQSIQKDETFNCEINVGELLSGMTASYDKAYEEFAVNHNYNFIPGIPYPWDSVSHLTKGLTPGMHIIAARPSVGKTSFVLQCINYWCSLGYKVAFDCLDMSVTEMIKRPVANLSWVSPSRMEFGRGTPEEQRAVRLATEEVRRWYKEGLLSLTVEPDVDRLKDWAEIRRNANKLDILVIDFAQRFRLKGSASEYDIVTYATGVLKQLSNQSLLPIILLSQLSRDNVKDPNGKRPPELSDLRGSGALEQDATTVVLLHKVAEVNTAWRGQSPMQFVQQSDDERLTNERASSVSAVCWNLAKNQNGPIGEIPFVVFQNCFRWYVGDEDEEKAAQYMKIQADWRFMEEPFLTAQANDAVTYPDYWPQKCAETCGKLGVALPPAIVGELKSWDLDRYHKLLAEHTQRMQAARVASATPLTSRASEPIPSIAHSASPISKPSNENLESQEENNAPSNPHPKVSGKDLGIDEELYASIEPDADLDDEAW